MTIPRAALAFPLVLAIAMLGRDAHAQDRSALSKNCAARFAELDKNGDRKLSFQEFDAVQHPEGKTEWIFNLKDTNRDGFLTRGEFCPGKTRKKPQ